LLALLVFALLTFRESPAIDRNEPTPLIGVWERMNIGVFLIWTVVLAIRLWPRTVVPRAKKGVVSKSVLSHPARQYALEDANADQLCFATRIFSALIALVFSLGKNLRNTGWLLYH
jgi:hypothetical protein